MLKAAQAASDDTLNEEKKDNLDDLLWQIPYEERISVLDMVNKKNDIFEETDLNEEEADDSRIRLSVRSFQVGARFSTFS